MPNAHGRPDLWGRRGRRGCSQARVKLVHQVAHHVAQRFLDRQFGLDRVLVDLSLLVCGGAGFQDPPGAFDLSVGDTVGLPAPGA